MTWLGKLAGGVFALALVVAVAIVVFVLALRGVLQASEPAPIPSDPTLVTVESMGDWRILHDNERGVTCWASDRVDGGISCLPDSALRQGAGK